MLNATTRLLSALIGDVFTSWISCDAVQVLIGLLVIGMIIKYLISLFKF